MPTKILPDADAFARFTRALLRRGFRKLLKAEFRNDFKRLEPKAPSPREGREVGFTYTANGLSVLVWTTFLSEDDHARDKDAGWVLIKEGDIVKYFSHPLHRTKKFLYNLLRQARIAQLRVLNRPLCPKCHARMHIVQGKGLKARYWKCIRHKVHEEPECLPWDYGLPEAALDFLRIRRKQRAKYRKELRAEGKKPGVALNRRREWKIGRLDNIVPKQ